MQVNMVVSLSLAHIRAQGDSDGRSSLNRRMVAAPDTSNHPTVVSRTNAASKVINTDQIQVIETPCNQ